MKFQNKWGLYVHWPFCRKKCPYCDFNSHVSKNIIDQKEYLGALISDLRYDFKIIQEKCEGEKTNNLSRIILDSIFFGGGTPSLMQPFVVEGVINEARKLFKFTNDIEISLEANPTSSNLDNFKRYKNSGVNRISIGVQSLNDNNLKLLGREHNSKDALYTVENVSKFFKKWSFDMIYALPNQSLNEWMDELENAQKYMGGHASLYQLTIEEKTEFKKMYDNGILKMPADKLSVEMYKQTHSFMENKGYDAYEVSNYAKENNECKHNLIYWNYDNYIGIGAGAHGRISHFNKEKKVINTDKKISKFSTYRYPTPEKWLSAAIKNNSIKLKKEINLKSQVEEFVLMGMRLKSGIYEEKLIKRFNVNFESIFIMKNIEKLILEKLLILDRGMLRATFAGRCKLNSVISYILK